METQTKGKLIFNPPGVEIRMEMGHVYVNGEEVDAKELARQALELAVKLNPSGQYQVANGLPRPDTVTISHELDYRD